MLNETKSSLRDNSFFLLQEAKKIIEINTYVKEQAEQNTDDFY